MTPPPQCVPLHTGCRRSSKFSLLESNKCVTQRWTKYAIGMADLQFSISWLRNSVDTEWRYVVTKFIAWPTSVLLSPALCLQWITHQCTVCDKSKPSRRCKGHGWAQTADGPTIASREMRHKWNLMHFRLLIFPRITVTNLMPILIMMVPVTNNVESFTQAHYQFCCSSQ